ncbi:MAG TPA: Na+/H+ antiporter NhaA [Steroidobacteraceae bacterium]|nr:Na+/H+ antiporter NhaA [Steroidobacteraceae bacterium]
MIEEIAAERTRPPAQRLFDRVEGFLHIEAASGIILLIAAAAALIWANSPSRHAYEALWHTPVTLGIGEFVDTESLHFWINDGLMAIFFLLVGLEIRHELHEGALSSVRQAALPCVAALGGVLLPASIYFTLNAHDPQLRSGWAVPTTTDIAFAVGVLALLGKRVPPKLRVLLLALAIIDDIAAIVIIALFYSSGVSIAGLGLGATGVVLALLLQRFGIRTAWLYVIPGVVVWLGLLVAGIHPAIAGVIMGLITPVSFPKAAADPLSRARTALEELSLHRDESSHDARTVDAPLRALRDAQIDFLPPVLRVQAALHPWVAYGVMPVFAFANAGVTLSGLELGNAGLARLSIGVIAGLVVGKPLGIVLATAGSVAIGLCRLPDGVGRGAIFVMGCLGGIGFTMAIFVGNLAFEDPAMLATAKFAVLLASVLAASIGLIAGRVLLPARSLSTPTN